MVTASVMVGSAEAGELFFTAAALTMLNLIWSSPRVSLASWMAALKVHWLPPLRRVDIAGGIGDVRVRGIAGAVDDEGSGVSGLRPKKYANRGGDQHS
jgi:hypothetical protein